VTRWRRAVRRFALALQAACVTSVALYSVDRVVQAAHLPLTNLAAPVAIGAGVHAGYFWRVWTACYASVMVGFTVFAAAPAHEARIARGLVSALSLAVVFLVVQGIFVP
jgi:hypothetical protein